MSPRTPEQFEEIREEKRTLIMNVALEHFANEGFHKTTINHVARHAGISKGLIYNYFKSKEELLFEIIKRSVDEVFSHFDPDRDGFLTEMEFEFFVRKLALLLREKKSVWRLFFQMMMQKDVREKIPPEFSLMNNTGDPVNHISDMEFLTYIYKLVADYFKRKVSKQVAGYDPDKELEVFLLTLKGFAVTYIFSDVDDEAGFNKTVEVIIEKYL
jgi:AcrR family transcriptional regulator